MHYAHFKLKSIMFLVAALVLCVAAVGTGQAVAQTTASATSGPSTDQAFAEARAKVDEFDQFDWPPRGRFTLSKEFTKSYVEFNRRLWNDYGILYVLAPTVIMQKGTQGGNQNYTANEQLLGLFGWRLLNNTRIGTGYFIFNNIHVGQLTSTSGIEFSQALGINYFTSDSVANTDTIKYLGWRHELPGDVFSFTMGHGEINSLDGGCRYACDDTQSFLSSILSTNPARTLPGQGTEFAVDMQFLEGAFLEFSAADARGNGKLNFGRPFDTGEWAYAGALKFENPFDQFGDGLYKFTYYSVDETRKGTPAAAAASQGLTIQLDQDFGDLGAFFKYHQAFKRKGLIKRAAGAGVVWNTPFGNNEDRLGLGLGWVKPTAPNTNDEYVAETYYMMQLTPFVQVSADAMLTINPSRPGSTNEGVFTLRARAQY